MRYKQEKRGESELRTDVISNVSKWNEKHRRMNGSTHELLGLPHQIATPTKKFVIGRDTGDEDGRKEGNGRELHGFDFGFCF